MSFLESGRRKPPRVASPRQRRRRLIPPPVTDSDSLLREFFRHYWTLAWAGLHLLGLVAGGWLGRTAPDLVPGQTLPVAIWAWRLAALLPLLLAGVDSGRQRSAVWIVIAYVAATLGYQESRYRQQLVFADAANRWSPSSRQTTALAADLRLTSWPRQHPDGWTGSAVITALAAGAVSQDDDRLPERGELVLLRGEGAAPTLWSRHQGLLEVSRPRPLATPGGFAEDRFLAGRGITWRGRFASSAPERRATTVRVPPDRDLAARAGVVCANLRACLVRSLRRLLPPPEASLAASVLLGEKDERSRAIREPFAILGLAHLFAVSGLHVGILLAMLLGATRLLTLPAACRLGLLMPTLLLYVVLTGMPGSVCRAVGLALLVLLAPVAGRRSDTLHLLGLLAWMNYCWLPTSLLDTGTRLSYLAAVGIVAVSRQTAWLRERLPRPSRPFASGLLVTLAAQWFTMPEIMASFGWISVFGPVANLVAVPVFGLAVWCCVLALAGDAVVPWLAEAAAATGWLLFRLLAAGAGILADLGRSWCWAGPPFGPLRLGIFVLVSAGYLLLLARAARGAVRARRHMVPAGVGVLVITIALVPAGRFAGGGRMSAVQFDVSQGDCALLVFPDRQAVVIDTGPPGRSASALAFAVVPWLRREGIDGVAAVVLSHGHADHTGGAFDLAAATRVQCWYVGGHADPGPVRCADGAVGRRLHPGDRLHESGGWSLTCLAASVDVPPGTGENNLSVVVGLHREGRLVAVWSGDLEAAGEHRLLAREADGPDEAVQLWKAGHHGSRTSGTRPFLDWLRPRLVAVSCGVENRFDHPSHGPYTVGEDTIPMLRTDLDGSLLFRWGADGTLHWRTARGSAGSLPQTDPSAP